MSARPLTRAARSRVGWGACGPGSVLAALVVLVFLVGAFVVALEIELLGVEHADEAVLESPLGEVDDQAQLDVGRAELAAEGKPFERADLARAGEDLDGEPLFNKDIDRDAAQVLVLVDDLELGIELKLEAGLGEFELQSVQVDVAGEARAEGLVHLDRAADDEPRLFGEGRIEVAERHAAPVAPAASAVVLVVVHREVLFVRVLALRCPKDRAPLAGARWWDHWPADAAASARGADPARMFARSSIPLCHGATS